MEQASALRRLPATGGEDALAPAHADLHVACDDGATTITLNRPHRRNALGADVVEALHTALDRLRAGSELLVFRGAGGCFSSGLDLADLEQETDETLLWRLVRIEQLLQRIYTLPVLTIAFAQGHAYGAGADLFCACRHRVAAPGTRFAFPGVRFGLALGTGRLAARVGETAAWRLLSSASPFDDVVAADVGLVTERLEPQAWSAREREAGLSGRRMDADVTRLLVGRIDGSSGAADLATLVQSACRPGLKTRILAYLAESQRQRSNKPEPGKSTE